MQPTAVVGAVFVDVKGFSKAAYMPTGTNVGTVEIVHGGVSRNVCENLANQGQPVFFVSMTENSAMGRDVCDRLSGCGVGLRHMLCTENGLGMWLAILDEHGELAGSISRQPDFAPLEDYLREHGRQIVEECGTLILEIDMNESIARMMLGYAAELGRPVYTIVGSMSVILHCPDTLRQLNCFICNDIEAGRLFNMDLTGRTPDVVLEILIRESMRAGIRSMVVTMGADGAVYCDHTTGEAGHCPAVPCEKVDSTGAGDAFFSGTVIGLSSGLPLGEAVRIGARMASATLTVAQNTCPPL